MPSYLEEVEKLRQDILAQCDEVDNITEVRQLLEAAIWQLGLRGLENLKKIFVETLLPDAISPLEADEGEG